MEPDREQGAEQEFVPPGFVEAMRIATRKQGGGEPQRRWVLIGIPACIALGIVELLRALDGNMRSWVYTIEWPFFAGFIGWMYWKLGQAPKDESSAEDESARPVAPPDA